MFVNFIEPVRVSLHYLNYSSLAYPFLRLSSTPHLSLSLPTSPKPHSLVPQCFPYSFLVLPRPLPNPHSKFPPPSYQIPSPIPLCTGAGPSPCPSSTLIYPLPIPFHPNPLFYPRPYPNPILSPIPFLPPPLPVVKT